MYKKYDNLVPQDFEFHVSNSAELVTYPEYNLPPLEVPNLDDPTTTSIVEVNEIYDLFNAQRLSGFDNDIVESIRSNILASSPYSDAISKLSDDEIMESIKPRNLQSPSQLVAWSKYIQSVIEERINSVSTDTKTEESESTIASDGQSDSTKD